MTSINISVPKQMREWVDSQIEAGRYGNVSEYFRHLIRKHQAEEAQERLDFLLLEGLESGDATQVTPEFWESKRQQLMKRLQSKKS
jgi:antitoxin ParD1/3/4